MRAPLFLRVDGPGMNLQRRCSSMRMRTLGVAGVTILLGAVTVGVLAGGGTAKATTGDESGLPEPPKAMPLEYVYPIQGRWYLAKVDRKAHIVSGLLDMQVQYGEPEWLYGELEMLSNTSRGESTSRLPVYDFQYAKGHVSALLIQPGSVSSAHPYGITIGRISFVFPRNGTARVGHNREPKEFPKLTGDLTLNGKTAKFGFTRGSTDKAPLNPLPKAKQIGRS
jgi:hypothetical protein